MKAGIGFCSRKVVVCAGLGVLALTLVASAAPQPTDKSSDWIKAKGAKQEGPLGPAVIWLDEATRARGGAASGGSAEALIFHQPADSGYGYFEKTYDDGPLWFSRMGFGNGWAPGNFISAYETKIYHSTSDDVNHGPMDLSVALWDGDPLSIMETVCSTGGVPAPVAGTAAIIAGVPYGTVVTARIELAAKVAYDCDRVWMVVQSLNGCRAAVRISGEYLVDTEIVAPEVGFASGIGMLTGCESSTWGGACQTPTGYKAGFCCGSIAGPGTCSGSGADCHYVSDCPAGETCDGREVCDHTQDPFPIPCSSTGVALNTFCGDGLVMYYLAYMDIEDAYHGYVGSIFAATDVTMSVVPVSVDAIPASGGSGAGVVSLGGDEVVLQDGNHSVWMEIMIGNWDPSGVGVKLAGYLPAINAAVGFSSGISGTLGRYTGGITCGLCDDDSSACSDNVDCTFGACSTSGDPCHLTTECPSGESCDGAALCVQTGTATADCEAVLGLGTSCGPPGYDLGTGTCSWAYTDADDPRWALIDAGATLAALDVSSIDARPSYAVVVLPPGVPDPFPAGGMYASTFVVDVPADAKGTFTIGLKPFPLSALSSGAGPPIALLGTIPGKITVQTGACCFNLQLGLEGGQGCLDGNQSAGSCVLLAGVTKFTEGASCSDEGLCDICLIEEPSTYEDFNACTDNFCIDGLATFTERVCVDGLVCTDDDCDPDDEGGLGAGCFYTFVEINDKNECTIDDCTEAAGITHTDVVIDDLQGCTADACDPATGIITNIDINTGFDKVTGEDLGRFPCPTGDYIADGCPVAANGLGSTGCTGGWCECVSCFADYPCSDDNACRATIGIAWSPLSKPNTMCVGGNEKVTADVLILPPVLNDAAVNIDAGQFVLNYDPDCMTLNFVDCSEDYPYEIYRDVSAGRILLACGVDPFGQENGPSSTSGATLASASFTKLDNCSACNTWFTSDNPDTTAFTGTASVTYVPGVLLDGQPICADPLPDAGIIANDKLSLNVPPSQKVNTECETRGAVVTWAAPTASSSCGHDVDLVCTGQHEDGTNLNHLAMGGGLHAVGLSFYGCTATSVICGDDITLGWTVEVNSNVSIDVTVQLSPPIAGDMRRCIKFALYSDCLSAPEEFSKNLDFGGIWNFVGHFKDSIKAVNGQYGCITAQDQLHSLRSCVMLGASGCVDGSYVAIFKGDPFLSGNWLQQGNLDGWKKANSGASHDVIDIYDFAAFMGLYLSTPNVDTPCSTEQRVVGHADFDGDGVVNSDDLFYVTNNFLDSSKDCCCGAAAGVTVPVTEVSVRELREMGMGDLAIADLDSNGLVNMDDITAFMAGDRPVKVAPVRGVKGSGVRSR